MVKAKMLLNNTGVHMTSRGPYIVTYTGKKFFPLDVRKADIDIKDIAHALSLQCRFSGHCEFHYSVAQHSALVSYVLPDELKLEGLLHDASEAYLVDVPRPIKHIADFSAYRKIEKDVQDTIFEKYGITEQHHTDISKADNLLLATEARQIMDNPSWARLLDYDPTIKIQEHSPRQAEQWFLREFERLTKI